jgi:flavodoxin
MKKFLLIIFALLFLGTSLCAKTLIVYYSHSGNTEKIALSIQELTGADLVKIETANPNHYPSDYRETVEQVRKEAATGFLPEIREIQNLDQYDTIFIGSPTWAVNASRPIVKFLTQYDLSGKTIIPFNTYKVSGAGRVHEEIIHLTLKSHHLEGAFFLGESVENSQGEVEKWLRKIKIKP